VWGTQRDITERKRAEEALRESEERFRSAFESAAIGMALVRLDGSWLEVNRPFAGIVGYSRQEMAGMAFQDITHPDDLEADLENMRRLVAGEIHSYQMEKRYIHKDGRVVWVLLSASLVRDARGKPLYGIGQVQDITQRKQAEEELRQSEELYRAVIEQATENIFLVDVETKRIVESNHAFREALGYSAEELRAVTLYDVVAADAESVDANVRRVSEQRSPFLGERRYRRKDGSLLNVEVSASIILRGGRETLCAVAHDVTERARMQELLGERVATLSGIAADLVLDLPMEDTLNALARSVVRASTAVSCLIVLIDDEDDSIRMAGAHGVPEGHETAMQAAYEKAGEQSPNREAVRTRRPVLFRNARRVIPANPRLAHLHHLYPQVPWDAIYVVPLLSRGKALGAISFGYPPGQEPGEEEKVFLGAVADQAAVAVENARLFSEARGKAALEERQRLARELHDSVSQALYGIVLGARTAREEFDEDPAEVPEILDYVLSLAEAGMTEMSALIFELRPESLETEGLVAAIGKQAAALEARHGIEVEADLHDEPQAPLEAKVALYRIVQEALHNTVKHARAKGVRIKMGRDPESITLEISDDGAGFDPEENFPGHLGLRSMRERALGVGGTLEVDSAPGKGTRIRAFIPV